MGASTEGRERDAVGLRHKAGWGPWLLQHGGTFEPEAICRANVQRWGWVE